MQHFLPFQVRILIRGLYHKGILLGKHKANSDTCLSRYPERDCDGKNVGMPIPWDS